MEKENKNKNICLLGLSRSGKTCYIYAAKHVLSHGIESGDHKIHIKSENEQQCIRLDKGIEDMEKGWWPEGSKQTMTYPFEFMIDGQKQFPFTIYDYRGGALNDTSDNGQDDRTKLYEKFDESSCIVFLIDGYTLLDAIDSSCVQNENRSDNEQHFTRTEAINRIRYMEVLVDKCRERTGFSTPILLVITKKDIFSQEELDAGIELLRAELPTLFSKRNDMIVGITSVSLGRNLNAGDKNEVGKKKLTGVLSLNTSQNLHIPILFALFQGVEDDSESYQLMKPLFKSDVIKFFKGGEPAVIY